MTEYRINLSCVRSFPDFVRAFNEGMIVSVGGGWGGGLDALNDYLSWPEDGGPYRLTLIGWDACSQMLQNIPAFGNITMLKAIREIFDDNPHVTVVYEQVS